MLAVREVVGPSPRRTVFYIDISWHMLCDNSDLIGLILGEQESTGQSRDSGASEMSVPVNEMLGWWRLPKDDNIVS